MRKLIPQDSNDGQFYFTLVGRNGKVIMTSETYTQLGTRNRIMNDLSKETGWSVKQPKVKK